MRFSDFLRSTVLMCGGAATALAAVTVAGATADDNRRLVYGAAAWWLLAVVIGGAMGRRRVTTKAIGRLLADARSQALLPEQRPAAIMLNRLWPLLLSTVIGGAVAFRAPQVPAIAAGLAIAWALAWRRQDAAVTAIEERDGARFYVEPTSPLKPMRLVRTPGFKAFRDSSVEAAQT